jgi:hypothetical protein
VPRFEQDDLVIIRDVISHPRKGQAGRVMEIRPAKHGRASTLDKYIVRFTDGHEEELWDIQLAKPVRADSSKGVVNESISSTLG